MNKKQEKAGIIRDEMGRFIEGTSGNPDGRKPETVEQKIVKQAVRECIEDYRQQLAKVLPEIGSTLITEAQRGNIKAIMEIHRVLGIDKPLISADTPLQIDFVSDFEKYR